MNFSRFPIAIAVLFTVLLLPGASPAGAGAGLPGFVPNHGQWDGQVMFRTCAGGAVIWFTPGSAVYEFVRPAMEPSCPGRLVPGRQEPPRDLEALVIRSELVGACEDAVPEGLDPLPHSVSYLLGSSEEEWVTGVPCYGVMLVRDVYPGIDVEYAMGAWGLKYSFVVHPGADPSQIATRWDGVTGVEASPCGGLRVGTAWGEVFEGSPEAWQEVGGGRVRVECRYVLGADGTIRYEVGETDPWADLVIDPLVSLSYSTYLGGSNVERATAIAVDGEGRACISGYTLSTNFPTQVPYQGSHAGSFDAFVTRLSASGSALSYSTYLGGAADDIAFGITVDPTGCVIVTGYTASADFPLQAPFQGDFGGGYDDAFITKLSASGSQLVFSTYLGGSSDEEGLDVELCPSGSIDVAGRTNSSDFPTEAPFQGSFGGGNLDAFLARFDSSGSQMEFGTYLGGSDTDEAMGVDSDASSCAYITGYTLSTDFPVQNPLQVSNAGETDAFAVKFTADGGSLAYSTYLGGSMFEYGYGIAVDDWGRALVAGGTESPDFPVQNPFQEFLEDIDAFVTRYSPAGDSYSFSTYLGGTDFDVAQGISVDGEGCAYVAGYTNCTDFPLQNAYQGSYGGGPNDAFATKFYTSGSQLVYSTYLGGSSSDGAYCIALDSSGAAYTAGHTNSGNYPVVNPFQGSVAGSMDAFVTKLTPAGTGVGEGGLPGSPPAFSASVAPCPCSAAVEIKLQALYTGSVGVTVFTLDGRVVDRFSVEAGGPGVRVATWDSSGLPSGVYLLRAADGAGGEAACRLVVLR